MFIKKSSLGTQQTYYNVLMYNIFSNLHQGHFPYINGISRDTAGGASVNMDDDIVGKGQQEILTFYLIQSQYFHLVFCTLSSFLSSSTN